MTRIILSDDRNIVPDYGPPPPRRRGSARRQRLREALLSILEAFNSSEHPRYPKGDPRGGKFAPKEGGPITRSVSQAARLLAEGKPVRLKSVRQVSTLLDRLAKIANDAKAKGADAPNYDLCQVSVKGTNLFCAEHKGIPRVQMPQLKGRPVPGSEASSHPVKEGEVDGSAHFQKHLERMGVRVTNETELASHLKASQSQLVGAKVAGMMTAKGYDPSKAPIFVSRDNYVVDGHHRWAATVGRDAHDGRLGDLRMNVQRVDMDIVDLLRVANDWADAFGIAPKAGRVKESRGDDCGCGGPRRPRLSEMVQASGGTATSRRARPRDPAAGPPPLPSATGTRGTRRRAIAMLAAGLNAAGGTGPLRGAAKPRVDRGGAIPRPPRLS